jgi:hypothetical protein
MSQSEFDSWVAFYNDHPFDDYHRRYRPAALIARSMSGSDIGDLLEWLQPKPADVNYSEYSEADMRTFKALGVTPPRRAG